MGRNLYFDIESDGLMKAIPSRGIRKNTRVHCIGAIDMDTDEEFYWGPPVPLGHAKWTPLLGNPTGTVEDSLEVLASADLLVAHNGIGYDYKALEYLFPGWKRPAKSWDSMVVAKVVWPYDVLWGPDLKLAEKLGMDGKTKAAFIKRHSLKAWGIRTGTHKDEYTGGFDEWNPDMASYMMQDNRSGLALWRLILKRIGWTDPEKADLVWPELVLEVENEVARIIDRQEDDGIKFDRQAAQKLAVELTNMRAEIADKLVQTFGSWWQPGATVAPAAARSVKEERFPDITVPRYGAKGQALKPYVGPPKCHYSPDAPYTPIEWTTFNPSSRDHLGMRLQAVYGWKPKKFGNNGKPTVDESVLEEIPEAVMPKEVRTLILDYFVVNKTMGMLVSGSKAWIHLATDEDRIHGRMDTAGAVTGRCTHMDPNMSQVPAVKKEKVKHADGTTTEEILRGLKGRYGYECRALMTADDGWEQTGVDTSSLELILMGHYLHPYDGGKFSERVCDPTRDAHKEHAEIAGVTRADAKTAIYLRIYGGSAYKLSLDPAIIVEPHEVPHLLQYRGLAGLLNGLARRFDQEFVDKMDDMQKARLVKARQIIIKLEAGIPGLKEISEAVTETAKQRGWLKGLDGRKVVVRKSHAAFNSLLQSAGAQVCKLWVMLAHRKLEAHGLISGIDYKQNLFVHDELGFTHRPGLGRTIERIVLEAIPEVGVMLGLRGTLRGDAKHGYNWASTH